MDRALKIRAQAGSGPVPGLSPFVSFGIVLYYVIYKTHLHWRRSALNSAGALQGRSGEFRGIFTPFYTINFRGLYKSGGARAPAAPASSAPMCI